MQSPLDRPQRDLLWWGTTATAIFWWQALETWRTYPTTSGFWVGVGLIFLAVGFVMGVVGWSPFWLSFMKNPGVPFVTFFFAVGLIVFGPKLLQGPFFNGLWTIGAFALSALAVMSFLAFLAVILGKWLARKQETSQIKN